MTLIEEINAKCTPELIASREHGQIAAVVSEGRTELRERMIGIGTVLKYLGPVNGAALLDQMEALKASDPTIKWGWYLLERGELDVALESTRAMIDALLPADAAAALKALAVYPAPVSTQEVVRAMEGM